VKTVIVFVAVLLLVAGVWPHATELLMGVRP